MGKIDSVKACVRIPPHGTLFTRSTTLNFTTLILSTVILAELDLGRSCFSLTPLQYSLRFKL
jgi:hypothetical protein